MDVAFEKMTLSDRKIIVGIDFGTTFSGIAWAETKLPDRRDFITTWPVSDKMLEGESSGKVPTKMRYDSTGKMQWGFAIPITADLEEVVQWFKLDLDEEFEKKSRTERDLAARGGRTVDQLITDYMSALGSHLYYTLRHKLGDNVVVSTPFEFVITVPAIWSDSGKARMLKACKEAPGLKASHSSISLVAEPEAAAIFTLHGLDPHGLCVGDSFVVCDAGGGTVDLITYTVSKLKPVLEVKEAAPGTGSLCGSSYLNRGFSMLLQERLGIHEDFSSEILAYAMEFFEKLKRQFALDVDPDESIRIPVNGMSNHRALCVSRGWWNVSARELQERVFEPVMEKVVDLVEEQIFASKVPIKAVCLVGGFGSSVYLRQRLSRSIDASIKIMQPSNAWTAVVMGAVMKGLAISASRPTMVHIAERRARKHYGHEWSTVYCEKDHASIRDQRYWDDYHGTWKVKVMNWIIRKGDKVAVNQPFIISMLVSHPITPQGPPKEHKLYISMDKVSNKAPLTAGITVENLCIVTVAFRKIPARQMERRTGKDGKRYYYLQFELETVFRSASTEYTMIYKGQRHNTVSAEYV